MALFKRRTTAVTPAPIDMGSITSRIGTSGGAMVDKATQYYRQNPKKVQGAALLASAVLLGFLKKRGTP